MECDDTEVVRDDDTTHSGNRYRAEGVARVSSNSSSSSEATCVHDPAIDIPQVANTSDGDLTSVLMTPPEPPHEGGGAEAGESARSNAPEALELPAAFDAGTNGVARPEAPAPILIDAERPPFETRPQSSSRVHRRRPGRLADHLRALSPGHTPVRL